MVTPMPTQTLPPCKPARRARRVWGWWVVVLGIFMLTGERTVHALPHLEMFTTPKGVNVWLMRTTELPMLSVAVEVRGGSAFEPKGQEGLAGLTAGLLDEGAGTLDAKGFKEALEAIGARLGVGADAMDMSVQLTTLTAEAPKAMALLGQAMTTPTFAEADVARVRASMVANLQRGDEDPSTVAWRLFRPRVFGAHPYANGGDGTVASVGALTAADLRQWWTTHATRRNLRVAVVGDVTQAELTRWLDAALGALPEGTGRLEMTTAPTPTGAGHEAFKMAVPQGTVLLGHVGLARQDPDFYALMVMNQILGADVLTSRLGHDIREVHGLVYNVRSVNSPQPLGGMFYITLATDNAKVQKALDLAASHLKRIRTEPVRDEEFDDAKAYLLGSFPLRMDSNAKLLGMLGLMQNEGLGEDYLQRWPERIAAVTLADVQRVAQRVLQPDAMQLVVVGDKEALKAQWKPE